MPIRVASADDGVDALNFKTLKLFAVLCQPGGAIAGTGPEYAYKSRELRLCSNPIRRAIAT